EICSSNFLPLVDRSMPSIFGRWKAKLSSRSQWISVHYQGEPMGALRFIPLAVILAALLILPATNRTVHSVAATQQAQQADQANVAKTTDSTWTSGSVDLEGVPENDTTTFTFSTTDQPDAAKSTAMAAVGLSCAQPPFSEAPANGFDDETNGLIP